MKKFLFVLIFLIPGYSFSQEYEDFDDYQPNTIYSIGTIVKYKNHLWVSTANRVSVPTSGIGWNQVILTGIKEYNDDPRSVEHRQKMDRFYYVGNSVKYHNQYFTLVKPCESLIPRGDSEFHDFWKPFSHPGIGFDIPIFDPDSDEAKSLLGVDTNDNGIRDDFEIKIIMGDLAEPVKHTSLSAGYIYGKLMSSGVSQTQMSGQQANQLMSALVSVKQCKSDLSRQSSFGKSWRSTFFYNTKERHKAKFKFQNRVYRRITTKIFSAAIHNACDRVNTYKENN
ncbi:hypothetical protein D5018_20075 [Parashewanella curva]|uniref:Uncharacterized protein n=1 Tax=Parashewanella curva TaxID=2338552 RepID=A0A3L8PR87_9GAMM|nr:hypothetical protein [Parashewanella curva]RLV57901.1 hypothetical protein D5018_20075 [Parashewanella curva]